MAKTFTVTTGLNEVFVVIIKVLELVRVHGIWIAVLYTIIADLGLAIRFNNSPPSCSTLVIFVEQPVHFLRSLLWVDLRLWPIIAKASIGDAIFAKASMGDAIFGKASMGDAIFAKASMGEAIFGKASMGEAIFGKASMGEAIFAKATMGDAIVGKATMGEANFAKATMGEAEK